MSCWKGTVEPSLEASTILAPVGACPALRVVGVLAAVVVMVVVVEVAAVVFSLCCSRRFYKQKTLVLVVRRVRMWKQRRQEPLWAISPAELPVWPASADAPNGPSLHLLSLECCCFWRSLFLGTFPFPVCNNKKR